MFLYVVTYGCGCGDNQEVVKVENYDAALNYAYQSAIEDYESYAGLHGIRTREDILEEEEILEDEIEEYYLQEVEDTISYSATPFDITNELHLDILEVKEVV